MIAIFFAVLAAVYVVAWSLPAIGFDHDDAGYLIKPSPSNPDRMRKIATM